MSRRRLAILFGVCFCVFAIVNTPLSAVVAIVGAGSDEFRFQRVEGGLWKGRILGASLQGHGLGDIETQLDPLGFFTAAVRIRWTLDGGLAEGDGVFVQRLASPSALVDAKLRGDLRRFALGDIADRRMQGLVDVSIRRATFDVDGCKFLNAQVWTDALMHNAEELGWSGPPLAGDAMCKDRRILMALEGEEDGERITIDAALDPTLAYQMNGSVETTDPELRIVLPFLGFTEEDGVYGFTQEGVLAPSQPVS